MWLFHAHAYFDEREPARVAEARAFADRIAAELGGGAGDVALHYFIPKPVGPHPRGSFEVLFTREVFADCVTWLAFQRPEAMSILVHPLTASQLDDHVAHGIWLGPQLALLPDILVRSDAANVAAGRSEESIIEGTKKH